MNTAPLGKKEKKSTRVTSSGEQQKKNPTNPHPTINHKPKINFREYLIMNLSTFNSERDTMRLLQAITPKIYKHTLSILQMFLMQGKLKRKKN